MQIPQSQNIHSQSFLSNLVEFVWRFPTDGKINQILFQVTNEGHTLLQEGILADEDNYENSYITSAILTTKNLTFKELEELKEQSIKYLL